MDRNCKQYRSMYFSCALKSQSYSNLGLRKLKYPQNKRSRPYTGEELDETVNRNFESQTSGRRVRPCGTLFHDDAYPSLSPEVLKRVEHDDKIVSESAPSFFTEDTDILLAVAKQGVDGLRHGWSTSLVIRLSK